MPAVSAPAAVPRVLAITSDSAVTRLGSSSWTSSMVALVEQPSSTMVQRPAPGHDKDSSSPNGTNRTMFAMNSKIA